MRAGSPRSQRLFGFAGLSALVAGFVDCSHAARSSSTRGATDGAALIDGRVGFPLFADESLTVRDPVSGMTMHSRLREAQHAPSTMRDGALHYADAVMGGGDVTLRQTVHGAEDFVRLPSSTRASLSYEIALDARVAGLRLIENTLELLDDNGVPRLRAAKPYLVDSSGKRLPIALRVEGCAVSTDPLPPFHRAPVSPGAHACILHLSWQAPSTAYPIVVDPAWSSTEAMSTARYEHMSTLLPSGAVLVAGGLTGDPLTTEGTTDTAELYSDGAWAAAASLLEPRVLGASAKLANGDVLLTGGLRQDSSGQTILGTSEVYSIATGLWTSTGALAYPRSGHTATAVGDGTILVAGGYDNGGNHFDTAELYSAGNFSAAGTINTARFDHLAFALSGNRVLLGAGTNAFTGALGSLELYTAGSGWSAANALASMTTPRLLTSGALLPSGDVVFIGGYNATDGTLAGSETYHPQTNTWTVGTGAMTHGRYDAVASPLTDGRILVVGGEDATTDFGDGEIFDPITTNFSDICGMSDWRAYGHSVTLLGTGNVLVAGGHDYLPSRILTSSDVLDVTLDDGGFDASACVRHVAPPSDAGSDAAIDSGADASAAATDASSEIDAAVVHDPARPPIAPETGPIDAAGGCSTIPSDDDSPIFLTAISAFAVLLAGARRRSSKRGRD